MDCMVIENNIDKVFEKSFNGVYVIGEIGINHNGDVELAKNIMLEAKRAGFSAVKFQKRNPEVTTPNMLKEIPRETPWGMMSYLEYKKKIEFGEKEFQTINEFSKEIDLPWFASAWDNESLDFLESFNLPVYKIASACLTNANLLKNHSRLNKPIILSTGMSSFEQIRKAEKYFAGNKLAILHCTSSYPCELSELNLRVIETLRNNYPNRVIGYSGHESSLSTTLAAVTLGAKVIERHITTDRSLWGTDQSASLEPEGMRRLIGSIRNIIIALGDGEKKVYRSEEKSIINLRVVDDL